jgi:hypothetical protein
MKFLGIGLITSVLVGGMLYASQDEYDVDLVKKTKICQALVNKGVKNLAEKPLNVACLEFAKDIGYRFGEIFLFLFDDQGVCYCHGSQYQYIWQDFGKNKKGKNKESFIQEMLDVGAQGGFVSYDWENSLKQSYVRVVTKDDKRFIIGAGFFPESSEFIAQHIVKRIIRDVSLNGIDDTFEHINDPYGKYVKGDIYAQVFNLKGICLANGDNRSLVGQNLLGSKRIADIIAKAKNDKIFWYDYESYRGKLTKRNYAEVTTDPNTGDDIVVFAGFYPKLSDVFVRDQTKRGIDYLKRNGKDKAFQAFSNQSGAFIAGSSSLFALSADGYMLADGENPKLVGEYVKDMRDGQGKLFIGPIIDHVLKFGSGWFTFVRRNAYETFYAELAETVDGNFIIGSSYFPASKRLAVQARVEHAADYFVSHGKEEALRAFASGTSDFLRGDLKIAVYDENNICLVDGASYDHIWRDESNLFDASGYSVVEKLFGLAERGGGWMMYKTNNASRWVYAKKVSVNKKSYAVSSGYYI